MFFNKVKKISTGINKALQGDLLLIFRFTKYWNAESKRIDFPFEFFDDPYVLGFIQGFISAMTVAAGGRSLLNSHQRGQVSVNVWIAINPLDAQTITSGIISIHMKPETENPEYYKGYDEAFVYVATRAGRVSAEAKKTNPIYQEAVEMARFLHEAQIDLDIGQGPGSTGTAIASAIFLSTIKKHIEQKFL